MPKSDVYPLEYFTLKEKIRNLKLNIRNTLSRADRANRVGKIEKFNNETIKATDYQAELFIRCERVK